MAEQAEGPVDVVIFFDANMPNMDSCSGVCASRESVYCKHRFHFRACLVNHGASMKGLTDFQVVRFFFDLIKKNDWSKCVPRPKFILVTKDHDFVQDALQDYLYERKRNTAGVELDFFDDGLIRCGDLELMVVVVRHKPYGDDRASDLRHMVEQLNWKWDDGELSE